MTYIQFAFCILFAKLNSNSGTELDSGTFSIQFWMTHKPGVFRYVCIYSLYVNVLWYWIAQAVLESSNDEQVWHSCTKTHSQTGRQRGYLHLNKHISDSFSLLHQRGLIAIDWQPWDLSLFQTWTTSSKATPSQFCFTRLFDDLFLPSHIFQPVTQKQRQNQNTPLGNKYKRWKKAKEENHFRYSGRQRRKNA